MHRQLLLKLFIFCLIGETSIEASETSGSPRRARSAPPSSLFKSVQSTQSCISQKNLNPKTSPISSSNSQSRASSLCTSDSEIAEGGFVKATADFSYTQPEIPAQTFTTITTSTEPIISVIRRGAFKALHERSAVTGQKVHPSARAATNAALVESITALLNKQKQQRAEQLEQLFHNRDTLSQASENAFLVARASAKPYAKHSIDPDDAHALAKEIANSISEIKRQRKVQREESTSQEKMLFTLQEIVTKLSTNNEDQTPTT